LFEQERIERNSKPTDPKIVSKQEVGRRFNWWHIANFR
jgi:hypothetical protein